MDTIQKIDILETDNYIKMKEWLENPEAEEPAFAESFMTTMYLMYMNRKGPISERYRRRISLKIDSIPSIKKLIENVENKEKANKPENISNETESPEPVESTQEEPSVEQVVTETEEQTVFDQPVQMEKEEELTAKQIGRAVRHCARLHGVKISDSHIQLILYVLYGYRLAKGLEDVFAERPQMWKYGPVFASSFSSLKKTVDIEEDCKCWRDVNRFNIELGTHIINLVAGLGERKVKELAAKHTAIGTPWHECRVMNPDKWGTPMNPDVIKEWFMKKI